MATDPADPTGALVGHVVLSRAHIGDVPALAMALSLDAGDRLPSGTVRWAAAFGIRGFPRRPLSVRVPGRGPQAGHPDSNNAEAPTQSSRGGSR